jgi:hypothetical protein
MCSGGEEREEKKERKAVPDSFLSRFPSIMTMLRVGVDAAILSRFKIILLTTSSTVADCFARPYHRYQQPPTKEIEGKRPIGRDRQVGGPSQDKKRREGDTMDKREGGRGKR